MYVNFYAFIWSLGRQDSCTLSESTLLLCILHWPKYQDMLYQWSMPINTDQCRIKILLLIQNVAQLVSMPEIWSGIDRYWSTLIIDTACPEILLSPVSTHMHFCSIFLVQDIISSEIRSDLHYFWKNHLAFWDSFLGARILIDMTEWNRKHLWILPWHLSPFPVCNVMQQITKLIRNAKLSNIYLSHISVIDLSETYWLIQDLCDLWVMGIYGDSNQEYWFFINPGCDLWGFISPKGFP